MGKKDTMDYMMDDFMKRSEKKYESEARMHQYHQKNRTFVERLGDCLGLTNTYESRNKRDDD